MLGGKTITPEASEGGGTAEEGKNQSETLAKPQA